MFSASDRLSKKSNSDRPLAEKSGTQKPGFSVDFGAPSDMAARNPVSGLGFRNEGGDRSKPSSRLRNLTKKELAKWMVQSQLNLAQAVKMSLNRRLKKMSDDAQPFESPFYWAAFCAIAPD